MILFFHEKFDWLVAFSLVLAIAGVFMLSTGPGLESSLAADEPDFGSNMFLGVTLSLAAGLCNALYFVGIQVAKIPNVNGLVMTFYVMLFGAVFCLANALACDSLQWIEGWMEFGIAFLLALVTAVLSNLTLIMAIKRVGSTIASLLGVMEPLTAVVVGILVFGESFSLELMGGVILIIASVILVLLGPKIRGAKKWRVNPENSRAHG